MKMIEIHNRINELNKLKAETIDKIEIVQKAIVTIKIKLEIESENSSAFFKGFREWGQEYLEKCKIGVSELETIIAGYDKEIEECKKILGEAKQNFPLDREFKEKQLKSYEQLYEELYEQIIEEIKLEKEHRLKAEKGVLAQEDIDALLGGGATT